MALKRQLEALPGEAGAISFQHPRSIISFPAIEGKVLVVEDANRPCITLDKGRKDGVRVGYFFDIYDGSNYKGEICIISVEESVCSGVLVSEKTQVLKGDVATTRL